LLIGPQPFTSHQTISDYGWTHLPTQSPWLNPIEPKWVHAKRNMVEHNELLTARQLAERICAYFGCSSEPHLVIPEKAA
jgi:hypothetical protein